MATKEKSKKLMFIGLTLVMGGFGVAIASSMKDRTMPGWAWILGVLFVVACFVWFFRQGKHATEYTTGAGQVKADAEAKAREIGEKVQEIPGKVKEAVEGAGEKLEEAKDKAIEFFERK